MKSYEVKNTFYLDGILRHPGEIVELDDDQLEYFKPKDVIGKEVDASTNESDDVDGVKHVGGGYYELPNGEKIKGKADALKALELLKAGEVDAQTEAGDTADTGTGDKGADQDAAEV